MTSDELLSKFREEVGDLADPPLWTPALVYTFIDEAQKQFCRLTDGIADSSSSAATLYLEAGEPWVPMHPSVLRVRSARDPQGRPVKILPVERLDDEGVTLDDRSGRTKVLISGMEEQRLRAWPIPAEDTEFTLSVFRLPKHTIFGGGEDLEIREEHHYALLHWMKHLAYGKQDTETYDPRASEKFETKFRIYCEDVKREQARLRRTPEPIAYGGY